MIYNYIETAKRILVKSNTCSNGHAKNEISRNTRLRMAKTKIKRPRITADIRKSVCKLHRDGLGPAAIFELRKKQGFKGPSVRSLQDIIKKATEVESTPEFEVMERPWSLGDLVQRAIPPEVLPTVLRVSVISRTQLNVSFTNREAQWAVRFSGLVRDPMRLAHAAIGYAQLELVSEVSGTPLETAEYDVPLLLGVDGVEVTPELREQLLEARDAATTREDAVKIRGDRRTWERFKNEGSEAAVRASLEQEERDHPEWFVKF
jgi:hypothetical protein